KTQNRQNPTTKPPPRGPLHVLLIDLDVDSTSNFGESLDFSLFPEPEVVFTNKEKVQKEVKAALSENATLSCEVAQEKTEVKWYKDGKLISSSKKFKVESEGKSRRLVVGQVEKKDAGEYTCEAAGQKLTFKLEPTGDDGELNVDVGIFEEQQWSYGEK
uniref:Ig-like domain-containing protein n=1 Tax=Taeniopygia guttata TaxID=59729 RepID=A0A674GTA0_TAEGU